MPRLPRWSGLLCLLTLPLAARAHSPAPAATEIAAAAQAWLDALTPAQRQTATFPLPDAERENWHYVPKGRAGLPLARMTEPQRRLARALLASGLSQRGLVQAEAVIALEGVLRAIEHADHRDETLYYFTVFGRPGDDKGWGWRIEGHHLSINFTIVGGHISATPNFVGANPAEVHIPGPQQGRRALAAEEDLGRALVKSLDETQRRDAIVSTRAPDDILTRNDRIARPAGPAGLGYARLTPGQQAQFKSLVELYAGRLRPEVAAAELKRIEDDGWNRLSFAWAGGLEPGQGHYYRIQGPDFVIEYDNTQNNANHIHTVWRVFDGDFGRDLLKEHYQADHAPRPAPERSLKAP
jgi:hypothetical protein